MKTKAAYFLSGILILSLAITSCSSDDDTTPPIVAENDCVDYDPTSASNVINGVWEEPNNTDTYIDEITIPDDFGGGYIRVFLSQSHPDLKPWLTVDNDLNDGAAIISGSSAGTNNELVREAYFSVYPGMNYSIEVSPFFNAPVDDYPIDYTLEWEFFSRVDCFELNDSQSQAKKILLGETIEAYAIAGYRDWTLTSSAPETYDWYKVELNEAGKLETEVLALPNDMRIQMRLFKPDGNTEQIDFEWLGSETNENNGRRSKITSTNILNPGTYYIELHSENATRKAENDTQPIPSHFNTTYKIKTRKL